MSDFTKDNALKVLSNAKNIWSALHEVAANTVIKSKVGKVYLAIQSTAGGVPIDTGITPQRMNFHF
jgi:hypothetical protein